MSTSPRLHENRLSGQIPAELGKLSDLSLMVLRDNQLTGSIPTQLGDMPDLYDLDLRNNQLTGSIPSQLENLSLGSLYLSGNQFTGCIPAGLRNVRNNDLASLNLPFCGTPTPTATPTAEPTVTPTPTATATVGSALSTDATLSSLALSDVPFAFSSDTTSYAVNVPSTVEKTTVTATTSDDSASYVVKKGNYVVDGAVPLSVGANVITVEVTAEDGVSKQTYAVTVTRAPAPVPSVPTLTAQASADAVELRWTEVPGAAGYELWVLWDAETGWRQLGGGGGLTERSYRHTGVMAGTTYYYYIVVVNAAGERTALPGMEDTNFHLSMTVTALSAPRLTVQASADAVELRWTEAPGAVGYELWVWWDEETGWRQLGSGGLTGRSYRHTDVTVGKTYYYVILAVNAAGETSAWPGEENSYHHLSAVVPATQH